MPTPPVPSAGGAGKFSKWFATHKPEAALGAGGIAVTLFLAYRAHQQSVANGGTTSSSTPSSVQTLPAAYTGGSGTDELGQLIPLLQQELAQAGAPAPAAPAPAAAAPPAYTPFATGGAEFAALESNGEGLGPAVYWQEAPGVYGQVTGANLGQLPSGTQLYAKTGSGS